MRERIAFKSLVLEVHAQEMVVFATRLRAENEDGADPIQTLHLPSLSPKLAITFVPCDDKAL